MNDKIMTAEEALKYATSHETVKAALSNVLDCVSDMQSEYDEAIKRNEILDEQLRHARELLDNIQQALRDCNSGKQAREAFIHECDDSMFER